MNKKYFYKQIFIFCLVFFLLGIKAFAIDSDDYLFSDDSFSDEGFFSDAEFFSDEDLFSDDIFSSETLVETPVTKIDASLSSLIFETGSVRFGGSLSAGLHMESIWIDPFSSDCDFLYGTEMGAIKLGGLENTGINPTLDLDLFFDSRPSSNTRLYGKFNVMYPFNKNDPNIFVDMALFSSPEAYVLTEIIVPNFSVFELFTDFNYDDKIYFRFGKHTVKWGVAYFFSPADIINLAAIDPEDPEKQREGPISLRVHFPIEGTQTNLWFYILPDEKTMLVKDSSFAFKAEFLVATSELGFGAWYRYNSPPHLMGTFTGSLAGKVGLFAETVFAWGNEDAWQNDRAFTEMKPVLDATLGASYYWEKAKINLAGQYLFGFDFSNLDTKNYTGAHKAALSLSRSEFIIKKMSLSAFALMDILEHTGTASLNLGVNFFDGFSLSTGPSLSIMSIGAEKKMNASFSLSLRFGGGRF
jgi:hypothetical protein